MASRQRTLFDCLGVTVHSSDKPSKRKKQHSGDIHPSSDDLDVDDWDTSHSQDEAVFSEQLVRLSQPTTSL